MRRDILEKVNLFSASIISGINKDSFCDINNMMSVKDSLKDLFFYGSNLRFLKHLRDWDIIDRTPLSLLLTGRKELLTNIVDNADIPLFKIEDGVLVLKEGFIILGDRLVTSGFRFTFDPSMIKDLNLCSKVKVIKPESYKEIINNAILFKYDKNGNPIKTKTIYVSISGEILKRNTTVLLQVNNIENSAYDKFNIINNSVDENFLHFVIIDNTDVDCFTYRKDEFVTLNDLLKQRKEIYKFLKTI